MYFKKNGFIKQVFLEEKWMRNKYKADPVRGLRGKMTSLKSYAAQ